MKWQYLESPDGLVAPGVIYDEELGKTCGFSESVIQMPGSRRVLARVLIECLSSMR